MLIDFWAGLRHNIHMVEVGTMVRFVNGSGRSGAIGQVLAVDDHETQPALTYRVLLLTPSDTFVGREAPGYVCPYVDAYEIEPYE